MWLGNTVTLWFPLPTVVLSQWIYCTSSIAGRVIFSLRMRGQDVHLLTLQLFWPQRCIIWTKTTGPFNNHFDRNRLVVFSIETAPFEQGSKRRRVGLISFGLIMRNGQFAGGIFDAQQGVTIHKVRNFCYAVISIMAVGMRGQSGQCWPVGRAFAEIQYCFKSPTA